MTTFKSSTASTSVRLLTERGKYVISAAFYQYLIWISLIGILMQLSAEISLIYGLQKFRELRVGRQQTLLILPN